MSTYRLPSPYERPPLRRRASGLALAVAVNLGLLFLLLSIGRFAPDVPITSLSRHKRPTDGAAEFANIWHTVSSSGE